MLQKQRNAALTTLENVFTPDTDPLVYFACYQFSPEFLKILTELLAQAMARIESDIEEEHKDDVRYKYGDLARITHLNFVNYTLGKFIQQFLPHLGEQLAQQELAAMTRYLD